MDFKLNNNLDLIFENGRFVETDDLKSQLLTSLNTDSRYYDKKGYWYEIDNSEFWILKQHREDLNTKDLINNIITKFKKHLKKIISIESLDYNIYNLDNKKVLEITIFLKSKEVVNQKIIL